MATKRQLTNTITSSTAPVTLTSFNRLSLGDLILPKLQINAGYAKNRNPHPPTQAIPKAKSRSADIIPTFRYSLQLII